MLEAVKAAARLTVPARVLVDPAPELVVNVICTRFPESMDALQLGSQMAHGFGAQMTVHLPREVPYPLPLTAPHVGVAFTEEKLLRLASGQPLDTTIQVYLCRDSTETIRRALKPRSIVVIAEPKHWWRTREDKLAAILRGDGHQVILTHAD